MHTAGGYLDQKTRSPVSLGAAIAINGAIIGALLLAKPEILPEGTDIFIGYPVEAEKPPEPVRDPPRPRVEARQPERQIIAVKTPLRAEDDDFTKPSGTFPPIDDGVGTGTGVRTVPNDPPPLPVFVGPQINSKYLNLFQPPYPPGKQRLGEEGVVVIRVLIGPDGRVKQVERVEAADDAFYQVTVQQALRKWRFTPATRDGVPVEGWREMTVRFELTD